MRKGAVIIETRRINIAEIIDNHFSYLPKDWGLTFLGTRENADVVKECFPSVNFIYLNSGPFNASDYNTLITSKGFWRWVPYDKVLIFQHDSKLLREGIEDFLEWDYVGAPWGHFNMLGGNGGLSIRTKQKMVDIIELIKYDFKRDGNEDLYFCRYMDKVGGKIAPKEVAMKFSVETIFYPTPIGVHAPEKYLKRDQLKQLGI